MQIEREPGRREQRSGWESCCDEVNIYGGEQQRRTESTMEKVFAGAEMDANVDSEALLAQEGSGAGPRSAYLRRHGVSGRRAVYGSVALTVRSIG